jgi:hypothetical protein
VALPSHRCYLSKPKHKSINLNPDNFHPYAQLMWEDRSGGIVTPNPCAQDHQAAGSTAAAVLTTEFFSSKYQVGDTMGGAGNLRHQRS